MGLRAFSQFALSGFDRLGQFDIGPVEGLQRVRDYLEGGGTFAEETPPGGTDADEGAATVDFAPIPADIVRWGKVTDDSPLTVQFAGDTTGTLIAGRNSSYTPVVDHLVVLIKVGDTWTVAFRWVAA